MDFAALMAAQIAKKKGSSGSAGSESKEKKTEEAPKKYMRNKDLEEKRKAEYLAAQKAREEERQVKAAAKRKREEEAAEEARIRDEKRRRLAEESRKKREEREAEEERARRKRLGLPELPPATADEDAAADKDKADREAGDDMEEDELRKALREHGAPAVLFGESHAQRLRRFRQVVAASSSAALANMPVPTTLAVIPEKDMKVPAVPDIPRDAAGRQYLFRQLASYFNLVLREWQRALKEATPNVEDETEASRGARSIMEQSRTAIKPLFRHLEDGDMDDKILSAIVEIVHAAQERRYVDANDAYLRLSIGKAAWPIGVIMVGIHERSAREKLHGGDKGGVMTDDVTRKYVQSIKRCLTFAQVRWPPEDASQLMG